MGSMGESENDRTLYCGGLHENVTEEHLYELFLQAGPLEKVHIPVKDAKKRNFGFITFKHAVSVPYSVRLMNGIQLYRRPLKLQARSGSTHDGRLHNPFGPQGMMEMPGFLGPGGGGQFLRSISAPDMAAMQPYHGSGMDQSQDYIRDRSRGRDRDRDRSYERHGDRSDHRNQSRDRDNRDYGRDRGRDRDRHHDVTSSGASSGNSTPEHPHGQGGDAARMNRSETFPGQFGSQRGNFDRSSRMHDRSGSYGSDQGQMSQDINRQRLMVNQQIQQLQLKNFQQNVLRGMLPMRPQGMWPQGGYRK